MLQAGLGLGVNRDLREENSRIHNDPLVGARRRFRRGLSKPGFETRLAESRAIARNKGLLAHFDTVIARLRVCDNLARILVCGQVLPDEFIETKPFRPPGLPPLFFVYPRAYPTASLVRDVR
jgi:hypothetical protein